MFNLARTDLRLRYLGDVCLSTPAKPIERVDGRIMGVVEGMTRVLEQHDGAGLAAPQVGISNQLFLLDLLGAPVACINPSIRESSGRETDFEGCLSIPGVYFEVERAAELELVAVGLDGEEFSLDAVRKMARAVQHEMDHLTGTLLLERVNPEQRRAFHELGLAFHAKPSRSMRRSNDFNILLDGSVEDLSS